MAICQNCGKKMGLFEKTIKINDGKKLCKKCFEKVCFNKICQPKEMDINKKMIEFISEYFDEKHARILYEEELKNLNIDSILVLNEDQIVTFVDDFIDDVFKEVVSLRKRGMVKAKLLSVLNLEPEDLRWQSYDQSSHSFISIINLYKSY